MIEAWTVGLIAGTSFVVGLIVGMIIAAFVLGDDNHATPH